MHSKTRSGLSIVCGMLIFVFFAGALAAFLIGQPQARAGSGSESGGNSKCYVCHPSLKTEDISTIHLSEDVTCDQCHGPSIEHMHDEMLMTKPDVLLGRSEVEQLCGKCHTNHENPEKVKAFEEKWAGRIRPNGRAITSDSVCTDCHGTHNIDKSTTLPDGQGQQAEWVSAFNGRDITGWKPSDNSSWTVKSGRITAAPPANGKGADLWTEAVYEDYQLAVTFRADWPVHAGIWVRGRGGPRVEIFDSKTPEAFTGSISLPGRGLVLVNLRKDIFDPEGYNTISLKVQGDRIQVWLNAEEIGAVRTISPLKGQIGLHIEKHPDGEAKEFAVREVLVQKLDKPK